MHHVIYGMMRQGKTTGAIELAGHLKALGNPIAVLTVKGVDGGPKDGERWRKVADFISTDPAAFLAALKAKGLWGWHIFVDEATQLIGLFASPEWIAMVTDSSSRGLTFHFIAHRPATLSMTIREQCTSVTTFRLGPKDAARLCEDWVDARLAGVVNLDKFEYMHCTTRKGSFRHGRVSKP